MSESIITNNSRERAVTTNYFDGAKRYAYRIVDGVVRFRIGADEWQEFPFDLPPGCRVENVAADNNRVFIRTTDNQLYWRCLKEDSASWVVLVFTLGELVGTTLASELIWSQIGEDQRWIEDTQYSDLQEWAGAYCGWVRTTHDPARNEGSADHPYLKTNGWNCLRERVGLEGDEIIDIAVGNWNNTVVTYYVLAYSRERKRVVLYYIDEETIMHRWEEVPGQEGRFDKNSLISASHSVVAAVTGRQLHWTRMDAHNPGHIKVWPLNWTETWNDELPGAEAMSQLFEDQDPPIRPSNARERALLSTPPLDVLNEDNYPGWHTVSVPVKAVSGFLIDVGYGKRPWPVPEPGLFPRAPVVEATRFASVFWKLYLLMATYSAVTDEMRGEEGGTEIGFLGENPIKPNSSYPVCCVVSSGDRHIAFAIPQALETGQLEWREIRSEPSDGIGSTLRRGMADICHGAYAFQDGCRDLTDRTLACVDRGYERCTTEADQGRQECSRREDQGYRDCCDWIPCSWICDAWVWVSNLVCVAWTWVSNWVCVAWTWVSNVVCAVARAVVKGTCSAIAGSIKRASCWAVSCWEK